MLVFLWLLPTASPDNKVTVTDVLTSSLSTRRGQMIQGSAPGGSHEALQSIVLRGRNPVLGNVVETLASVVVAIAKDGRSSSQRPCLGGTAPGSGVSHFVFPSGCSEGPCRNHASDVRDKVSDDEREDVCTLLEAERSRLEAEWVAGNVSGFPRWVPGRPARLSLGGVGGGRMLALSPEPAPRPT